MGRTLNHEAFTQRALPRQVNFEKIRERLFILKSYDMMKTDLKMPTNPLTFYLVGGCESIYLPLDLNGLVASLMTTGV